jgi:exonuclease III
MFAKTEVIDCDSRRFCAVRLSCSYWNLLLINVYMPFKSHDESSDNFFLQLSAIERVVNQNLDCLVILGGDFNVDLSRN